MLLGGHLVWWKTEQHALEEDLQDQANHSFKPTTVSSQPQLQAGWRFQRPCRLEKVLGHFFFFFRPLP